MKEKLTNKSDQKKESYYRYFLNKTPDICCHSKYEIFSRFWNIWLILHSYSLLIIKISFWQLLWKFHLKVVKLSISFFVKNKTVFGYSWFLGIETKSSAKKDVKWLKRKITKNCSIWHCEFLENDCVFPILAKILLFPPVFLSEEIKKILICTHKKIWQKNFDDI